MSSETTRIIRTKHDAQNKYFLVARETAQDTNLSYEALGVLVYLLSKPDDWTVRVTDLQKRVHGKKSGYGRGSIASIMRELCKAGYAELKFIRDPKTRHMTGREYLVYETPIQPNTDQPDSGRSAIPTVEEIAPIQNTDSLQSTENHSAPNGAGASQPKPRKREPFYDAIADVWETDASGIIVTIRSIMQGTATRRTIKDCNFNPPVTDVEEIYAFRPFMTARMAEKKMTAPPSAYTTIQAWFYDFRKGRVKKQSAPQVVIAPEPVEEVVTAGELAARRALTQSVRPEWEREGI